MPRRQESRRSGSSALPRDLLETDARVFVRLRETLALHQELAYKLTELERKFEGHDINIRTLFDAIRELAAPPAKPRGEIGFHIKEAGAPYRVKGK